MKIELHQGNKTTKTLDIPDWDVLSLEQRADILVEVITNRMANVIPFMLHNVRDVPRAEGSAH